MLGLSHRRSTVAHSHLADDVADIRNELSSLRSDLGTHAHALSRLSGTALRHGLSDSQELASRVLNAGLSQARHATDLARQQISRRPIASLAIAAGVGAAVIGLMLLSRKRP